MRETKQECLLDLSACPVEDLKFIKPVIIFRRQRWCVQAGAPRTAVLINWVTPFLFFREGV